MAIPSGEMTRRERLPHIDPVLSLGRERVLVSVGFPYEKLWVFCDHFIWQESHLCAEEQWRSLLHMLLGLCPTAETTPMVTYGVKRNGWGWFRLSFFKALSKCTFFTIWTHASPVHSCSPKMTHRVADYVRHLNVPNSSLHQNTAKEIKNLS